MIDFNKNQGSGIPPVSTDIKIPSKEEVVLFFENFCKKDLEAYLIYKKNNFKSSSMETFKDFFNKLEIFIRDENNKNENKEVLKYVFDIINSNLKLLEHLQLVPSENKTKAFLTSFISSKLLS